jgi:membrane protease YdiL (CAAX protease family)
MHRIVLKKYYVIKKPQNKERMVGSLKKFIERYKMSLFFLIALLASWSIWMPMALRHLGIIDFNIPIIIGQSIGGITPLLLLISLDKLSGGALGVKRIFNNIRVKGEKVMWLIPAALILPLATISGNILNSLLNDASQLNILASEPLDTLAFWLIGVIPLTFFAGLLSSPFFEEPCWRGFGLNHLQRRFGRHIGSLILGTYWWLWHQPINIANGLELSFYSYLLMVSHSFTFDSVFNLSNRNLLAAMFAHSSAIITYTYIHQSQNIYILAMFLIVIIVLRIVEWQKKSDILNLVLREENLSNQPEVLIE